MDNICFVDHVFLSSNPLTSENILDYFSTSPFYDKSSVNEILKMQNQYRGISTLQQDVSKHKGVFYVLDHCNTDNTLFVIRQSDNDVNLAYFYVIHGHIYKAPTNNKIFNTRINDIYWYLNEILDSYLDKLMCCNATTTVEKNEYLSEEVLKDVLIKFNSLYK